jgi:predicted nucleotidyltransferase
MGRQENEILRDFQEKITLRYPGSQIILFGSRARGDAGPQSDADVAANPF